MRRVSLISILAGFAGLWSAQPSGGQSSTPSDQALREFLRANLRMESLGDDETTRYFPVPIDLDGDGRDELIVHISGIRWCGSGGCMTLVLRTNGDSYEVVTRIRVTPTPVRVLATESDGWRSLSVPIAAAGPRPAYEAELPFDGESYPPNPTTPPARPLEGDVRGEVIVPVLSESDGEPLYAPD